MREHVTKLILNIFENSQESSRWKPCRKFIADNVLKSKSQKIPPVNLCDVQLIDKMSDEELTQYFELVIRRLYVQR